MEKFHLKDDSKVISFRVKNFPPGIGETFDSLINIRKDWRQKTDSSKGVFHELIQEACPDSNRPCIEWYKDDNEMVYMVRAAT